MKFCLQSLAALLGSAVNLCGQAALAGGPGCATCNGGGVGYAPTPMHWGVPADVSYGQLAPTDWNAPASRAGCCERTQRNMCDWWAGYCNTQRVIPCPSGDCNCGKRGWGEGYFGASIAGGCQRACNNVGHGHGCSQSCCAPACAPACGSCNECDTCAPACGSGCGSGFGRFFSGLFGGGHCANVVGGSSGPAACGCCPQRCGHGCAKPCGVAPCRARQTLNSGCCNNPANFEQHAVETNSPADTYYNTGATESNVSQDSAPSVDLSAPPSELVPTPAQPTPDSNDAPPPLPSASKIPLDISAPAPSLNNANRDLEDSDTTPPDSDEDSI